MWLSNAYDFEISKIFFPKRTQKILIIRETMHKSDYIKINNVYSFRVYLESEKTNHRMGKNL